MTIRHRFRHDDAVVKCAWLPNQPLLVSSTADGGVYVWDARDGRLCHSFTGHRGLILDFKVIPPKTGEEIGAAGSGAGTGFDSTRFHIVTAGDDGICRVYEL